MTRASSAPALDDGKRLTPHRVEAFLQPAARRRFARVEEYGREQRGKTPLARLRAARGSDIDQRQVEVGGECVDES